MYGYMLEVQEAKSENAAWKAQTDEYSFLAVQL